MQMFTEYGDLYGLNKVSKTQIAGDREKEFLTGTASIKYAMNSGLLVTVRGKANF